MQSSDGGTDGPGGPMIDQSVTSYHQSGGITAHTVNVVQAPRLQNGLYQSGHLVATVEHVERRQNGRFFFGVVRDLGSLKSDLPVEYGANKIKLDLPSQPSDPDTVTGVASRISVGIFGDLVGG